MKGIAFDIIFQNHDPDEQAFAQTLEKYDNIIIGTTARCLPPEVSSGDNPLFLINKKDTSYITCNGGVESAELDSFLNQSE